MDSKKLAKLIKVIVEVEVAKKHEQFLKKTFPKILEEEVNNRVRKVLSGERGGVSSPTISEQTVDPFVQAEQVLENTRVEERKQLSRNPVLNEVLNQTQPFTSAQRNGGQVGSGNKSVLDSFQQPQQVQENTHIPNYMDAEDDIEQTINMSSNLGAGGVEAMRAQMAQKMGYGNMNQSGNQKKGLGVQTGLPGLDRILNRDNSELVRKFKR